MRKQRKLSEETKRRMSKAKLGKKIPDEVKKRISDSMREYWKNIPYEIINTNDKQNNE